MQKRSAHHATFTLERSYDAPIARVFGAWSIPEAKSRWFGCHDEWKAGTYEMDFRIGGRERLSMTEPKNGVVHAYDARYQDIVKNERIVYAYDMHLDDKRITVSLATVEFSRAAGRTHLKFTEQLVVLDGSDDVTSRIRGTEELLASLDASLQREPAGT